jgi:hypothetical protein
MDMPFRREIEKIRECDMNFESGWHLSDEKKLIGQSLNESLDCHLQSSTLFQRHMFRYPKAQRETSGILEGPSPKGKAPGLQLENVASTAAEYAFWCQSFLKCSYHTRIESFSALFSDKVLKKFRYAHHRDHFRHTVKIVSAEAHFHFLNNAVWAYINEFWMSVLWIKSIDIGS